MIPKLQRLRKGKKGPAGSVGQPARARGDLAPLASRCLFGGRDGGRRERRGFRKGTGTRRLLNGASGVWTGAGRRPPGTEGRAAISLAPAGIWESHSHGYSVPVGNTVIPRVAPWVEAVVSRRLLSVIRSFKGGENISKTSSLNGFSAPLHLDSAASWKILLFTGWGPVYLR